MNNGWKNYQTWAVALWLGNDEVSYREARKAALKGEEELRNHVKDVVMGELASPDRASLAADLLEAALGDVDWEEVRGCFVDE